jgi:hypothetical protein
MAQKALCILLLLTLIIPPLFLITEADHNCSGDSCTVCHVIAAIANLQQQGSAAPIRPATPVLTAIMGPVLDLGGLPILCAATPVALKVRIDD